MLTKWTHTWRCAPALATFGPRVRNQAKDSIYKELRHRGEPLVAYPGAELWKAVGGSDGVAALIKDLYPRLAQDELLRATFSHFTTEEATPFVMQGLAGTRDLSAR